MKRIYMVQDSRGRYPVMEFMGTLDSKARKKLEYGFFCLATQPNFLAPPNVKHFAIEKYNRMYEYRARIKVLLRIIFVLDKEGDILLLQPFMKRHDRDTMQALEKSLCLLEKLQPDTLLEYVPAQRR